MTDNFLKLIPDTRPQIQVQKVQTTLSKINAIEIIPWHIIFKLQRITNKTKLKTKTNFKNPKALKEGREKKNTSPTKERK